MLVDTLLYGATIPGTAAGLIALLLLRFMPPEQRDLRLGAMAVGGGFAIAFAMYFGVSDLLAPHSWHWIFWASVAAIPVTLLRGRLASPAVSFIYITAAAALLLFFMIRKLVPHLMETQQAALWAVGLAVLCAILAASLEISSRAFAAKSLAPAWVLYAAAFAALAFDLGSARLGQMSGYISATCGALAALAWFLPHRQLLGTAAAAVALILMQIGANTYFFGHNVAGLPLLLAALPPIFLATATKWKWLRQLDALPTTLVLCAITLLPMCCALALAIFSGGEDPSGSSDLPY